MKKAVQIITPKWPNRWREYYQKAFEDKGYEVLIIDKYNHDYPCDLVLFMWTDEAALDGINNYPKLKDRKKILFCRRYEFFGPTIDKIDYEKVDHMIFCNTFFKDQFEKHIKVNCPVHLLNNGMRIEDWKFEAATEPGDKIAMICGVHYKKNIPMALQLMKLLKERNMHQYELHIAGGLQDAMLGIYINHIIPKLKIKVTFHDQIDKFKIDEWLGDKSYILSTSLSEGNPNNILEGMAKGLKPVIHNWPGSFYQFNKEWMFDSLSEACDIINGSYNPQAYRDYINMYYNFDKNFKYFMKMIGENDNA